MGAKGEPGPVVAALIEVAELAGGTGAPHLLVDRADVIVLRLGGIVVKAHPADTDVARLVARLRVASAPALADILLAPIAVGGQPVVRHGGRLITVWPYGVPVDPDDPDAAPWEQAATLLARLHATPVSDLSASHDPVADPAHPAEYTADADRHSAADGAVARYPIPDAGGPARVYRALARLRAAGDGVDASAAATVCRAFAGLPELAAQRRGLVHGDFHLGQLVRLVDESESPWRLVDIDDLGLGEPAWDLARPAAFYAAGILDPVVWQRFLGSYRASGGTAVPIEGNEWATLELPARAVAVQAAALAVAKADGESDELDAALVDACRRIADADATS